MIRLPQGFLVNKKGYSIKNHMKLPSELIDDIVKRVIGAEGVEVVRALKVKRNFSEFKLAEKLSVNVNRLRNILYKLQQHNLVTSTKKKDKKSGWYTSYWTFNANQTKGLIKSIKERELLELRTRIETERGMTFFVCPNNCVRVAPQQAIDVDYRCEECNSVLNEENNELVLRNMLNRVMELEAELERNKELLKPEIIIVPEQKIAVKPEKSMETRKISKKIRYPKKKLKSKKRRVLKKKIVRKKARIKRKSKKRSR